MLQTVATDEQARAATIAQLGAEVAESRKALDAGVPWDTWTRPESLLQLDRRLAVVVAARAGDMPRIIGDEGRLLVTQWVGLAVADGGTAATELREIGLTSSNVSPPEEWRPRCRRVRP